MRTLILLFIIFNRMIAGNQGDEKKQFVEFDLPPMIWLNADEKARLKNSRAVYSNPSFTDILNRADEAMGLFPNPVDSIFYEGYLSNHPRRINTVNHLNDMKSIYSLSWTYLITGEERYGIKTKEYLSAWVSKYKPTGNDVNENKLDICFFAFDAIKELLTFEERSKIKIWISDIAEKQKLKWDVNSGSSNRHAKRLKLIYLSSLILDDNNLKEFVFQKFNTLLETSLNADGTTRDLVRRDAMHYNVSCLLNILETANLLSMENRNYYLYQTDSGASLKNCVQFVLPYAKGEKIYKEWVNTKIEFDRKRALSGDAFYQPGKPWDRFEAIDMLILASRYDNSLLHLSEELIRKKYGNNNYWIFILNNILSN